MRVNLCQKFPFLVFLITTYLLIASFKALPGLKAGTSVAGIVISLPVCGLRPLRAARWRTSKVPKPTN